MSDFKVYIKNVKISPKKLRFLVSNVKKQSPVQAVHTLMYTQKKGATFLRKAISSALSNAKNTMNIDSGGSKGMAKPFRHEYSHIKLVLTTGDNTDKSIKSVKSIKSETEPVETEVKKTELKEVKSTKLKVKNATKEPKAEK